MSYVKPSNVPPARVSGQDVDPHSIKESTYMRGIYEDYHTHQLEFENREKGAEEGIAVNLDTVQQGVVVVDKPIDEGGGGGIGVLHRGEDVGALDKEQTGLAVGNPPMGLVVGEIAQELDGERQDVPLQSESTEGVPVDDRLGDLVFCTSESLERLHYTELTVILLL